MAKVILKDHTMKYLVERLSEAGIVNSRTVVGGIQTVHSWIRKRRLKFRRRPHNGYYMINDKEIEQIIKDFNPDGRGWWWYDKPR